MRIFRHIAALVTALLLLPWAAKAQAVRVSGTVSDAISGEAIPYATVFFEGTLIATTTDSTGVFSLETAQKDVRVLKAEVGGYLPMTQLIVSGEQTVHLRLIPDGAAESATTEDGPFVRSILYNVDRNRPRHDPESRAAWQARLYSKVELAVANADNLVGKSLFNKRNDLIPEYQDSTQFNGYIPILFSEAVLRRYFAREPAIDKEVFEASRISGLDQQNVLRQFTGSSTLHLNFYQDILPVFNISVPSPTSSAGHLIYHYTLVDSLTVDGRKTYSISFVPKKMITSPTMEGRMDIDAEDFAIRSVQARLSPSSNVNWIRQLYVDCENRRDADGNWFFDREKMFVDASVQMNDHFTVISLQMNRDITYTDVAFGPFPDMESLAGGDKVGVDEDPEKDDLWWEEARPAPLTLQEQAIFATADRVKDRPAFKWINAIGSMFITGFLENTDLGVGYGPWEKTVTFSAREGVRVQGGLRTTKEFSTHVRLGGSLGYGFGDKEFKWSAYSEFMLGDNRVRTNKLTVFANRDYQTLGRGSGVFTERNIVNSLLAPGGFDKQGLMFKAQVEHQYEFSPNFNSTLVVQHMRIYGNDEIPLIRPDGSMAESFSANQIHWTGRFSWDERVNRGIFDKSYIFTRYPIVTVDLLGGIKGITSDDCSFLRGELTVDWRLPAGVLGFGRFHLNGGAILGSVPYPLLKLHEGNQSRLFGSPVVSLLDKSAFSLMDFYEFGSDRWVTSFYEHNFNGLVFGLIPLVNRLGLREVVTVRGAWGTISEQNLTRAPFLLIDGLHSLETPYVEAGVGIANIFRLLRVDCFWKLTHRNGRDFAVNIGLDVDF